MKRLILILALAVAAVWTLGAQSAASSGEWLYIDKGKMQMTLFSAGNKPLMVFPVGIGMTAGNKRSAYDGRTPEGDDFTVQRIQNFSHVTFDYQDGKGPVYAYGPWFFRLKTGWKSIGIHGTDRPWTIGKRDSHGCIRMYNEDLVKLKPRVYVGMKVVIVPGAEDLRADGKITEDEYRVLRQKETSGE